MRNETIHSLWDTGAAGAPELVRKAFESWSLHAPGFDVRVLDQDDLDRHLRELGLQDRGLPIQAASDVLRAKLLREQGGVWLDATCLLTRPLGDWMPGLVRPSGFFAFSRPASDRLIASWCLASDGAEPLLEALLAALARYLSVDRTLYRGFGGVARWNLPARRVRRRALSDPLWAVRPDGGARHPFAPYYFFHYLFEHVVSGADAAAAVWSATPRRSAIPPPSSPAGDPQRGLPEDGPLVRGQDVGREPDPQAELEASHRRRRAGPRDAAGRRGRPGGAVTPTTVHIGFPKTATTTLQGAMMRHPGVAYHGKGIRDRMTDTPSTELARRVFFSDRHDFRAKLPGLRDRMAAFPDAPTPVFVSDEAFSFAEHMQIGSRWQRQVVTDHEEVAERLAAVFPGARVVMSTRWQIDLLRSFYRQSVEVGHVSERFETYVDREIEAADHRSMLTALDYGRAHAAYAAAFGRERVHVFRFEEARADFAGYLRAVAGIAGIAGARLVEAWGGRCENVSPASPDRRAAGPARWLPRLVGRIVPSRARGSMGPLRRGSVPDTSLRPDQERFPSDRFTAANDRMRAETGVVVAARA